MPNPVIAEVTRGGIVSRHTGAFAVAGAGRIVASAGDIDVRCSRARPSKHSSVFPSLKVALQTVSASPMKNWRSPAPLTVASPNTSASRG
jgi:hypothetical protein